MPRRKFSDEEEIEIEKQYNPENPADRVSSLVLAERWDCSNQTIGRIVNKISKMRTEKEATNIESYVELQKQNNSVWKGELFGDKHIGYKGGRCKDNNGYICLLIKRNSHPFAFKINGSHYIYEHRLIMEQYLRETDPNSPYLILVENFEGKRLDPKCIVHHRNEVRDDNKIENLRLFKGIGKHTIYHETLKKENNLKELFCH